jgi:two-component system, cell cycle response regulator DivK
MSSVVLIVEDYDDTRYVLCELLRMRGCEVIEARDGMEAVDLATNIHPDLILMDIGLPGVDGVTATQLIHANEATRSIPIIAVSAYCWDTAWKERATGAGCVECINKPVDLDVLEDIVSRYVELPDSCRN